MIWGKTTKQKEAAKRKVGDEVIKFMWFPNVMEDGRWCWLCWVRCVWSNVNSMHWDIKEVVSKPKKVNPADVFCSIVDGVMDGQSQPKNKFLRTPNPAIIQYLNLLHKYQDIEAEPVRKFLEEQIGDEEFLKRAKVIRTIFVMSKTLKESNGRQNEED